MSQRAALLSLLLIAQGPLTAHAQGPAPAGDRAEAGKRFTAGVALYNEADYRAALIEFKRAYDLAPNPLVLYNIGQTHYQLQNYAAAYLALTRYLAEAGSTADRAAEVTQTLQVLQARVGKIEITTEPAGAEITIDDEVVGTTPTPPTLVSIGRHRISVTAPGRVPWSRTIDVAAGDTVRQEVTLAAVATAPLAPTTTPASGSPAPTRERSLLVPVAWIGTGVLAAGAITFGVLALGASSDLDDLKGQYPLERAALTDQADKVSRYSHLADGLGVAALVVGATALTFTLLRRGDDTGRESATRVGIGPSGLIVGGTF